MSYLQKDSDGVARGMKAIELDRGIQRAAMYFDVVRTGVTVDIQSDNAARPAASVLTPVATTDPSHHFGLMGFYWHERSFGTGTDELRNDDIMLIQLQTNAEVWLQILTHPVQNLAQTVPATALPHDARADDRLIMFPFPLINNVANQAIGIAWAFQNAGGTPVARKCGADYNYTGYWIEVAR